jgi:hypothetical protein
MRSCISAFEACAVDVCRAFGGSWLVSLSLFGFYFATFYLGLLAGAIVFEALRPVILVATINLSLAARQSVELSVLFFLLYSFCFVTCMVARLLIRFVVYLLYEARGPAVFFLMVLGTIVCAVVAGTAGVIPAILSEKFLVQIAGSLALCTVLFGALVGWLQVRYRSSTNSRIRNFDHDIGLAWDHMTDGRRARFSFYRGEI